MDNQTIIKIFREIADLLELKGDNPYKIRAYRNVIRSLEELPTPVAELAREGRLREIPGAGEAITEKLTELVETGHLKYYENLRSEFPEGIIELLCLPGIGTKTAKTLYYELGIKSVPDLERALEEGRHIPHTSERQRENIRQGIREADSRRGASA